MTGASRPQGGTGSNTGTPARVPACPPAGPHARPHASTHARTPAHPPARRHARTHARVYLCVVALPRVHRDTVRVATRLSKLRTHCDDPFRTFLATCVFMYWRVCVYMRTSKYHTYMYICVSVNTTRMADRGRRNRVTRPTAPEQSQTQLPEAAGTPAAAAALARRASTKLKTQRRAQLAAATAGCCSCSSYKTASTPGIAHAGRPPMPGECAHAVRPCRAIAPRPLRHKRALCPCRAPMLCAHAVRPRRAPMRLAPTAAPTPCAHAGRVHPRPRPLRPLRHKRALRPRPQKGIAPMPGDCAHKRASLRPRPLRHRRLRGPLRPQKG